MSIYLKSATGRIVSMCYQSLSGLVRILARKSSAIRLLLSRILALDFSAARFGIFLRTNCGRLRVPLYVTPQLGCFYHCIEYRGDSCRSAFVSVPQDPSTMGLKRYRRKKKTVVVKILRRYFDQSIVMEFYLSFLPHRQTTRLLFGFTLLPC